MIHGKNQSDATVSNENVLSGMNVVEYVLQKLIQELDSTIDESLCFHFFSLCYSMNFDVIHLDKHSFDEDEECRKRL